MTKIILNGCCGKMGTVISNLVEKDENLQIVAGIDKFPKGERSYPIFSDLDKCTIEYDVLLDFSRPDSLRPILAFSEKNSKPVVLCSTGYNAEDLALIEEKSKVLPLFRSANMSVGVNLVNMLLRKISPVLYENFDIEVIEKHHNQKVDAPSGTAVMLAETIKNSIEEDTHFVYGREGIAKRDHKEIGIHAIRGGSIVGDHDVIFAGDGEVIEITHKAISREVFAVGALKASAYMGKVSKPGHYDMEDVLNLSF